MVAAAPTQFREAPSSGGGRGVYRDASGYFPMIALQSTQIPGEEQSNDHKLSIFTFNACGMDGHAVQDVVDLVSFRHADAWDIILVQEPPRQEADSYTN